MTFLIDSHDVNLNVDSSDAWRKQSRNIAQNQWRSRTCENCDHFKNDRLFIEDQLLSAQFFSKLIKNLFNGHEY